MRGFALGAWQDYRVSIGVQNVQIFYQAAMGGANSITVTLPGPAFQDKDSYIAIGTPSAVGAGNLATATGDGGVINPNLVVTTLTGNTVQVSTADGSNSSALVDIIAFGS